MEIKTAKSLAKNSFWLAIGEAVNGILMFFLMAWLARYLGAGGYGKLNFVLSFVTVLVVPINLGINQLVVREIAKDKKNTEKFLSNLLLIRLILGILFFLSVVFVIQFIKTDYEIKILFYLLGAWTFFQSEIRFYQSIYRAHEKMFFEALTRILHGLILALASFYLIFYNYNLIYFGWAYFFAALATLILSIYIIWYKFSHFKITFDYSFVKKVLKKSWPFAFSLLFGTINNYIDSIMLGIIKSDAVVGWYNAAYKILVFILLLGSVISRSTYPIISRLFKKSLEKMKVFIENYTRLMFILAIPLGLGGIALAPDIINFIYGEGYEEAILAFRILICTASLNYISTIYAMSLQACSKQKTHFVIMCATSLFNIVLNLLLIPKFSLYGAASVTLLTQLLVLLFMYFKFRKITKVSILKYILKPLIASIIMFLVLIFLDLNIFIMLFLGIVTYFVFMFIIRGFSTNDIRMLKDIFTKKA